MWLRSARLYGQFVCGRRVSDIVVKPSDSLERGIYSNVLGFPGGVAWALLTARICQLYPNAAPSTVVSKFFPIYYQWGWPQPVLLKRIDAGPPNMTHSVWNPKVGRHDTSSNSHSDRPPRHGTPDAGHHACLPLYVLHSQHHGFHDDNHKE